ncbi:unnamed protein product [Macrosiphum euphorbiae]|uniref:Reverse transcriptase domain-containing protein n=1 Tax=Macrosiphum euphorbiae TaxID=13131 RepID=A0AAV0Y177_9HEMI|nr:unnamed protein product [Macrosiphum euphorbiae]
MSSRKAPGLDGITAQILRKAWPIIGHEITRLFERCIIEATFPVSWKEAELVIIPKPGKEDLASPKPFRPISLLPVLGKALETLIIQDLAEETDLDAHRQQHGFVSGRSTTTAISELYEWTNENRCRHVLGTFLDITGAFDNVRWSPVLSRLQKKGSTLRTLRIVQSYLQERTVNLNLEGRTYRRYLERGCPQGSQLGPTLWRVAMTAVGDIALESTAKVIIYSDDIAVLVGAARPPTALTRIEEYLDGLLDWARTNGLQFSPGKSQLMSIKGGLKPNYSVGFGSQPDSARITASENVKYLGVTLDPRQSYLDHVLSLKEKNKDMFMRLRRMTSANWGMGRNAARTVYAAVFLPRITYAAEIWWKACNLKKSIKLLGSMQRDPLLAITSCYRTASTNCLSAVAGVLPLDLEIQNTVLRGKLRKMEITQDVYETELVRILNTWQDRYEQSDKGEWTKKMVPDVGRRYVLPLCLDHYTSQMLTGHGDFLAQLHRFKLVNSPNCKCTIGGAETVAHVLLRCKRTEKQRAKLIKTLNEEGEGWPPRDGAFLKTQRTYEALRKFANDSLRNREDR